MAQWLECRPTRLLAVLAVWAAAAPLPAQTQGVGACARVEQVPSSGRCMASAAYNQLPDCIDGPFAHGAFTVTRSAGTLRLSYAERKLLEEDDLVDRRAQRPSAGTCALVGPNAARLLAGTSAGEAIDKHDLVLRVGSSVPNATATEGKDVGTFTSLRLVHGFQKSVATTGGGGGDNDEAVLSTWCADVRRCGGGALLPLLKAGVRPLSPAFLKHVASRAFRKTHETPSLEMVGATLLLHICANVDVYGASLPVPDAATDAAGAVRQSTLRPGVGDLSARCIRDLVTTQFLRQPVKTRFASKTAARGRVRSAGVSAVEPQLPPSAGVSAGTGAAGPGLSSALPAERMNAFKSFKASQAKQAARAMTTKLGADAAPSAVTTSEAEVGGEVDHRQMVTDALLDRNAPPAAAAKQRRYIKQGAAKKSAEQGAAKKGPLTAKERRRVKLLKELGLHDSIEAHHADYVAMKKAHMDTEGSIQEVSIQRVQQQEDQDGEAPEVDAAEQI